MTTLLVANRGEIAIRIFRTARRMGMRCAAVYSDADTDAPHVRAADIARRIGPAPAAESYLRRDRILEAARVLGADLVHPGYGFLAEDARFAQDCIDLGFTFVGPPSKVLGLAGDKAAARAAAAAAGVEVIPGYAGDDQSDAALVAAAEAVGYPVIVKPAAGGGGKGMLVVERPDELPAALASARRIARVAVDDERLVLERYLASSRHVEVQVLADAHGSVVHLGERDCSLQRRHQKVMEEAPANLDDALREALHRAAVTFARRTGYVGVGTCEFLVAPDGTFGFIEMNARLQVEHPVTEEVTGLDLVELQLRVAMGQRLPLSQDEVRIDGHAIEVRVYAEDPEEGFLPQTGHVLHVRWPEAARVDAGIGEGVELTPHYDPLLAKIVVEGGDRVAAMWALHGALPETEILGVRTNLTFLRAVVQDSVVVEGKVTTDWLEDAYARWRSERQGTLLDLALAVAAAAEADRILGSRDPRDPWSKLGGWRLDGRGAQRVVLRPEVQERVLVVEGVGPYLVDGRLRAGRGPGCHEWWVGGEGNRAAAAWTPDGWWVWSMGVAFEIPVGPAPRRAEAAEATELTAPLPGQVVAVRVATGDEVRAGQELVVVEAMKMEHAIKAPADGTVTAVLVGPGDTVERGQRLGDFEPS